MNVDEGHRSLVLLCLWAQQQSSMPTVGTAETESHSPASAGGGLSAFCVSLSYAGVVDAPVNV